MLGLVASLAVLTPSAQNPPEAVAALQQHVRKLIDAAEPSVVALVVSRTEYKNPDETPGKPKPPPPPGVLGGYTKRASPLGFPPFRGRGGRTIDALDKYDLGDIRNIPNNDYGTGLVLDRSGLILTNYHLVENATKIFVRGPKGGVGWYADIHAADGRSDLAVLRLLPTDGKPLPDFTPVKFADVRVTDGIGGAKATVFRGQWVVSLAHPFAAGFADGTPSASWGMVSNVRQRVPGAGSDDQKTAHLYQYGSLIQTDARLNLGCSGGGLFDLNGDLIGLTTAVAAVTGSEASGGYALPMTAIYKRIIETLRQGREVEYGFLGVTPGGMTEVNGTAGLTISGTTPGMPAMAAGMRGDDVILSVNGVPMADPDDLFLNVGAALAGTTVSLRVSGSTGTRDIRPTLAKLITNNPTIASNRPKPVHGLLVEYSSILLQSNLGGPRGGLQGLSHVGVCVKEIAPGSRAETRFKAIGIDPQMCLITAVNDRPVSNPSEFYKAAADNRGVIRLTVVKPENTSDRGQELILP